MNPLTLIPKKLPLFFIYKEVLLPGSSLRIELSTTRELNFVKSRLLNQNVVPFNNIIGVITLKEKVTDFEEIQELLNNHPHEGTVGMVRLVTATNCSDKPMFTLLATGIVKFKLEKIVMEEPYPVGVVRLLTEDSHFSFDRKFNDEQLDLMVSEMKDNFEDILNKVTQTFMVQKLKEVLRAMPLEVFKNKIMDLVQNSNAGKDDKMMPLPNSPTKISPMISFKIPIKRIRQEFRNANSSDDIDDDLNDFKELEERLRNARLPSHAKKVAYKEFKRLKSLGPYSPEHGVLRNYVELLSELPWDVTSPETIDLHKAKSDLDADHYAMEKLKKRVLEYLAVRQLKNSLKGPILCFVGPPGVGKTSIGRSIANTLGREFQRISLGGVSNQSEIRGHRRTYIGAMPGRIIQAIKTAGVRNPVLLLDEIDKMGSGIHGDPASALLEVLDPEQNCTFVDHFVNVSFDLSQVMFIATANRIKDIPAPLLDRMEVIEVQGYTLEEKVHIAQRHLLPKQLNEHGLNDDLMKVTTDSIQLIINSYTMEGGVRGLERNLGALCRAIAVKVAETRQNRISEGSADRLDVNFNDVTFPIELDETAVIDILGPPIFDHNVIWSRTGEPGVACGLSWTRYGGQTMLIEACKLGSGDGQLVLTGHLGDVMKESAKIALNWVRSAAKQYGLLPHNSELMNDTDVHIHFPAGAVGKDGPSAGIAIACALISLFSGIPVSMDLAMTGELTLRGIVLPVGGIKQKVMAAHRAGLLRVIMPKRNEKDLHVISEEVKNCMKFVFVNRMEEVIEAAFNGALSVTQNINPLASKL